MNIVNKDELRELMQECEGACVSIYLPTHRAGKEVQGDSIRLKNLLDEAEEQLIAGGLRSPEARELLESARALLADSYFWQHQSDGLALFVSAGLLRYYRLPLAFDSLVVVSDRFHLKPLLSLLAGDGRFYVLALSQDEVRLLQGTHYSVGEVNLEHVPSGLAEALKWDEFERHTQFHTRTVTPQGESVRRVTQGGRPAIFHGHGVDTADEHKEHILRYFRQIDEGVSEILDRVETLFVTLGVQVRGVFNLDANEVVVHEEPVPGDGDLLDLAAVHTLLNGGTVYAVEPNQVPGKSTLAAVLRY